MKIKLLIGLSVFALLLQIILATGYIEQMIIKPSTMTIFFGVTAIFLIIVFLFSMYFIIHTAIIDSLREIFSNIQKTNVAGRMEEMKGGLPITPQDEINFKGQIFNRMKEFEILNNWWVKNVFKFRDEQIKKLIDKEFESLYKAANYRPLSDSDFIAKHKINK